MQVGCRLRRAPSRLERHQTEYMFPDALSRGALFLTSTATVAHAPSSLVPFSRILRRRTGSAELMRTGSMRSL